MKKEFGALIILLLLSSSLIFQGCSTDDKDILIIGELAKQKYFDLKNSYLQLVPLSQGDEPVIKTMKTASDLSGAVIGYMYDSNFAQLTPISDGKFTYRVQSIAAGRYFLGISRLAPKFERIDGMGSKGSEFARCLVDDAGKNIILDFKTDTIPTKKIIIGKLAVPLVEKYFLFTNSFYNFTLYEIRGQKLSKKDGEWNYKAYLNSDEPTKKISAAKYIVETGRFNQDDIDALISCLRNTYRSDEVKLLYNDGRTYNTSPYKEAKKALIRIGSSAVDKLIPLFQKESEGLPNQMYHQFSIWSLSMEILADIGDKKALPVMLQLLEEKPLYLENDYFLETFPIALAKVGKNDAFDPLMKAYQAAKNEENLKIENDPLLKAYQDSNNEEKLKIEKRLIRALGQTGDDRFIKFSREIITSNDQKRRIDALYGLQFFNDPTTVDFVISTLQNEDPWMRKAACSVLGKLKQKKALDPLRSLKAKEKNVDVQAEAINAITILEQL